MTKFSSVFRDMREIRQAAGSEPQASSDEPIAMDCTAASLEVLLFFMLDPSTVLKTKPELAAIEGVLLLRERFEFKVVETRMKLFFKNSVEDRPWTSLALSFRWRDVAMAREAIPHLRMAHGKPPGPVNPEFFHALMKIWYDMDWQSYSSTVMAIASRFSFQD